MASGSEHAMISLWDTSTRALLRILKCDDTVTYLAFSRDGGRLVSGSIDGTIDLWDADSGALLEQVPGDTPGSRNLTRAVERSSCSTWMDLATPAEFCIMDNGWMCRAKDRRRICWIPVILRPADVVWVLQADSRVAFQTKGGKSVIMEFTKGISGCFSETINQN
jgi:hypothetical protein